MPDRSMSSWFLFFPQWAIRKRFIVAYIAMLYYKILEDEAQSSRAPNRTPIQSGEQWFLRNVERPNDFYDEYRMSVDCFWDLHYCLREHYGLTGSDNMSSHEILAMFLSMCAHSTTHRRLGRIYEHSISTINVWYHDVLESICSMAADILVPRDMNYSTISPYIMEKAPEFYGAIGALDGTHIPAIAREDNKSDYIGRKGVPTQNVMVVVDFDMMFTHVYAGIPGSQHDAAVLRYSMESDSAHFPRPPEGKYYLVNSGYANTTGFLAPFRNIPYHPFEFTGPPSGMQEIFNQTHASLRNVVERTIGVWKKKWVILQHMREFKFDIQVKMVFATAALHNFIREHDDTDIDIVRACVEGYTRHDDFPDEPLPIEEHELDGVSMAATRNHIAHSLAVRIQHRRQSRARRTE